VVPTRRLSLVAAAVVLPVAAVVASGVGPWHLVVAASTLLLLLVALVDAYLAVSPTQLSIERDHDSALVRGDTSTMVWRLTNPATRSVEVAFADGLMPSLGVHRRAGAWLAPRGSAEIEHELRPSRRGRFDLGPITVRCAGPLGLGARERAIDLPGVLRVLPPFRSRRAAELRMQLSRITQEGLRSSRGRGAGTEFEQLREYLPGDDPRHIDWNATARSEKPIVRAFNVEQHQPVTVLLDCSRVMAPLVDGAPRLEHAMDVAVAFSVAVTRSRDRLSLLAYDDELRAEVADGAGTHQVGRVTEAVFGLDAGLVEADHAGALLTATQGTRRRSVLVMVTDLHETVVEESLAPAVLRYALDHVVIVVGVQDPELGRWATAAVDDSDGLHLAAAAIRSQRRRERAAAMLVDAGAIVVDAEPAQCAQRLVQTYLDLKGSARP
jgi:uncharacterized protein (DUF58 family)